MRFINRDTDYAIRALNYIARSEEEIVPVSKIAKELKISYSFLRKILQILHKEGLLKSYPGKDGGFELKISLDRIFLVDLIRIFQGPVKLADCLFKKRICPDIKHCLLKKKIEDVEKLVTTELKAVTIASLSSHP